MKYLQYIAIGTLGFTGVFAVASASDLSQPSADEGTISMLDVGDLRVANMCSELSNVDSGVAQSDEEVIFAGCASIF